MQKAELKDVLSYAHSVLRNTKNLDLTTAIGLDIYNFKYFVYTTLIRTI